MGARLGAARSDRHRRLLALDFSARRSSAGWHRAVAHRRGCTFLLFASGLVGSPLDVPARIDWRRQRDELVDDGARRRLADHSTHRLYKASHAGALRQCSIVSRGRAAPLSHEQTGGQSRGGTFARAPAARRPDLVSGFAAPSCGIRSRSRSERRRLRADLPAFRRHGRLENLPRPGGRARRGRSSRCGKSVHVDLYPGYVRHGFLVAAPPALAASSSPRVERLVGLQDLASF